MKVQKEFNPRTQRLSYASGSPKPYTLRKLTELQLAVLACARDDLIEATVEYNKFAHTPLTVFRVFKRFDVTSQVRSLTKRRLMKWPGRDQRHDAHFRLTAFGLAELAEHPEF